jgi:hypothetical protein
MRAWLEFVDDFLGDPPADAHDHQEPSETHPHRRRLRWERERRGGSVPATPAHCLCPIRRAPERGGRDEVVR